MGSFARNSLWGRWMVGNNVLITFWRWKPKIRRKKRNRMKLHILITWMRNVWMENVKCVCLCVFRLLRMLPQTVSSLSIFVAKGMWSPESILSIGTMLLLIAIAETLNAFHFLLVLRLERDVFKRTSQNFTTNENERQSNKMLSAQSNN